jgi:RimJ/RimL family protein N-acetyltransferase
MEAEKSLRMEFRITRFQDYARLAELDALYKSFRKSYLPMPDAQALWDAGEDGYLFVAERLQANAKPRMVAAAGLFPVAIGRDNESAPIISVMELAGMVVNPDEIGGFGIQEIMIALRTLAVARGEVRNCCLIASVAAENTRSIANLEKCGLRQCKTPDWLQSIAGAWCPTGMSVVNLIVHPDALCSHAGLVLKLRQAGELRRVNKVTGVVETVNLQFCLNWVHDETNFLQALSGGDFSLDWEVDIPKIRLLGKSPDLVEFRGAPSCE